MICPKCPATDLVPVKMSGELEVDNCPSCSGAWLDRSEIYHFVERPTQAYEELKSAWQGAQPGALPCPRCAQAMHEASLEAAELSFEACGKCGGTWFDQGEIQKLYGHLDAKWRQATGEGGAYTQAALGPRRPTPEELAVWIGPDQAPFNAVLTASAGLALLVLWFEPLRSPGLAAALGVALFLPGYAIFSLRRWYLEGAVVVAGEIGSYSAELGTQVEAHVLFTFGDYPFQITRIFRYQGPLDLGLGGALDVLVHPRYPRGAFVIPRGDAGPWSEADRRDRMSPQSLFEGGSLRRSLPGSLSDRLWRRRPAGGWGHRRRGSDFFWEKLFRSATSKDGF